MNAIAAVSLDWGIGKGSDLLFHIREDMQRFRSLTSGGCVIMGRKTLESFPNGMPLKNRTNIVLTGNKGYHVKDAVIVHSKEELLEELAPDPEEKLREIVERKYRNQLGDEKGYRRTVAALQRLGYGWEDIKTVLAEFQAE